MRKGKYIIISFYNFNLDKGVSNIQVLSESDGEYYWDKSLNKEHYVIFDYWEDAVEEINRKDVYGAQVYKLG